MHCATPGAYTNRIPIYLRPLCVLENSCVSECYTSATRAYRLDSVFQCRGTARRTSSAVTTGTVSVRGGNATATTTVATTRTSSAVSITVFNVLIFAFKLQFPFFHDVPFLHSFDCWLLRRFNAYYCYFIWRKHSCFFHTLITKYLLVSTHVAFERLSQSLAQSPPWE